MKELILLMKWMNIGRSLYKVEERVEFMTFEGRFMQKDSWRELIVNQKNGNRVGRVYEYVLKSIFKDNQTVSEILKGIFIPVQRKKIF